MWHPHEACLDSPTVQYLDILSLQSYKTKTWSQKVLKQSIFKKLQTNFLYWLISVINFYCFGCNTNTCFVSLTDWWSPRWCCEAVQHQVPHLLLWHTWNVSYRPLTVFDFSFTVMDWVCPFKQNQWKYCRTNLIFMAIWSFKSVVQKTVMPGLLIYSVISIYW